MRRSNFCISRSGLLSDGVDVPVSLISPRILVASSGVKANVVAALSVSELILENEIFCIRVLVYYVDTNSPNEETNK